MRHGQLSSSTIMTSGVRERAEKPRPTKLVEATPASVPTRQASQPAGAARTIRSAGPGAVVPAVGNARLMTSVMDAESGKAMKTCAREVSLLGSWEGAMGMCT